MAFPVLREILGYVPELLMSSQNLICYCCFPHPALELHKGWHGA